MTVPPRLRRFDALRIALLHTFSPTQQWALAEQVAQGNAPLPMEERHAAALGLRYRGRKGEQLASLPADAGVGSLLAAWTDQGYAFRTAHDSEFPRELWEIPDPPLHLFTKGTVSLTGDGRARVAVVGSRAASPAGLRIARELARDLALADCVVVSGLARGVDAAAHRGALEAGGDTLAVLGTGLDRVYPDEHTMLAEEIARQGLLITEFAPGTPPLPLHFPRRNRILVGLADALVVVEGGDRSGARSSVDHALDQGREVLAVPRDPIHEGSQLPNRLLREGAAPLVSVRDLTDLLSAPLCRPAASGSTQGERRSRAFASAQAPGAGGARDPLAASLRTLLDRVPGQTVEELARNLPGGDTARLLQTLSRLEVQGWVRRHPGGRWYPETEVGSRM